MVTSIGTLIKASSEVGFWCVRLSFVSMIISLCNLLLLFFGIIYFYRKVKLYESISNDVNKLPEDSNLNKDVDVDENSNAIE